MTIPKTGARTTSHNLPLSLTSFIGRDEEQRTLPSLLRTNRLLTLTGTGGCGKSRLSLHVAEAMLSEFPDGVRLVELAGLSNGTLLPQAIANVLDLHEEVGQSLLQKLEDALRPRRLLLILDNCEHLVAACAPLASTLLRSCPDLKILATSREPLGIPGEIIWRVSPLAEYDSVHLFVDRTCHHQPGFKLTKENALAVAQVCHRLDGVPLAIELAAARTRVLSVSEIEARLDDRFQLLTGGSQILLPRHQTLQATIDWSYRLLLPLEQVLWRRLAIFAGGFTLDAAESVCTDEVLPSHLLLDLLGRLIDKSIVVATEEGLTRRYHLLETIRQFGEERLEEAQERRAVQEQHLAWCLQLVEQAVTGEANDRFDRERQNIRHALQGSADSTNLEGALRLLSGTGALLRRRGEYHEARYHLEAFLERREGLPAAGLTQVHLELGYTVLRQGEYYLAEQQFRAALEDASAGGDWLGMLSAQTGLGLVAGRRGQYHQARALHEGAVALCRAQNALRSLPGALNNLGLIALHLGQYEEARRLHEEALAIDRNAGFAPGEAAAQGFLGLVAAEQAKYELAWSLHQAALPTWRAQQNRSRIAFSLLHLGRVAVAKGESSKAGSLLRESLLIYKELADHEGMAEALEVFASISAAESHPDRAARLLGAAAGRQQATRLPSSPSRQRTVAQTAEAVRARLRAAQYLRLWADGEEWSPEEAVRYALQEPTASPAQPRTTERARGYGLTAAELKVVRLIAKGLTVKEISEYLHVSHRTVGKHEENIRAKLELPTRIKVAAWAIQQGISEES